ncbi:MAG TPA: hypothetical protein VG368_02570, partial [Acidimicrobiales bacterium]|nr:hypothetical protein [Acidimicrobiales bacterium]
MTLSGPSLSDLTLRAEKERGAPPKRVSAVEKGVRRSGGLFGFFQREQEIVTITFEWDDQEPIAPALEERLEDALVAPPWSRAMASLLEDADETGDVVELAVAATAGREHVQAGGGSRTTFREELNRQAAALGDPGDRDDAVEAELRDLLQEREEYERRSTLPGALDAEHPFAQ